MIRLTLLFLLISQISVAQSNLAKEVIQKIEFKTDTIESVFNWITDNIRYDASEAKSREKKPTSKRKTGYTSKEEKEQGLLKEVLRKKRGVCEHYSILFNELVKELGYESFIIPGYTKNSKGRLNSRIGHTWNAVKVKNKWMLYDPTWGAGYLKDGKRFIKEYNPKWYEIDPSEMIETHMPYDPIWQLQEPISYQDFEKNNELIFSDKPYNPEKAIADYLEKKEGDQLKDQLERSLALGKGTSSMMKWRARIENRLKNKDLNKKVDVLNIASEKCNKASKVFNKFVAAQKRKFKGPDHSLELVKKNLEQAELDVSDAIQTFNSIKIKDIKRRKMLKNSITSSKKLLSDIQRALAYIKKKEDAGVR